MLIKIYMHFGQKNIYDFRYRIPASTDFVSSEEKDNFAV